MDFLVPGIVVVFVTGHLTIKGVDVQIQIIGKATVVTRMHSSRMRTVRCIGCLGDSGGLPRGGVCL